MDSHPDQKKNADIDWTQKTPHTKNPKHPNHNNLSKKISAAGSARHFRVFVNV